MHTQTHADFSNFNDPMTLTLITWLQHVDITQHYHYNKFKIHSTHNQLFSIYHANWQACRYRQRWSTTHWRLEYHIGMDNKLVISLTIATSQFQQLAPTYPWCCRAASMLERRRWHQSRRRTGSTCPSVQHEAAASSVLLVGETCAVVARLWQWDWRRRDCRAF